MQALSAFLKLCQQGDNRCWQRAWVTYLFVIYRPVCFFKENRLSFVGRDTFAYIYMSTRMYIAHGVDLAWEGLKNLSYMYSSSTGQVLKLRMGEGKIAPNAADWYLMYRDPWKKKVKMSHELLSTSRRDVEESRGDNCVCLSALYKKQTVNWRWFGNSFPSWNFSMLTFVREFWTILTHFWSGIPCGCEREGYL